MRAVTSLALLYMLACIIILANRFDLSPRLLGVVCFSFAACFFQPNGYFISAVLLCYAIRLWWIQ
jgi:hypothetical protein